MMQLQSFATDFFILRLGSSTETSWKELGAFALLAEGSRSFSRELLLVKPNVDTGNFALPGMPEVTLVPIIGDVGLGCSENEGPPCWQSLQNSTIVVTVCRHLDWGTIYVGGRPIYRMMYNLALMP